MTDIDTHPARLPPAADTLTPRAAVSWSGGKDSYLAWLRAIEQGLPVTTFVTMCDHDGASLSHDLPREFLARQVASCGMDWLAIDVGRGRYESAFDDVLAALRASGHTHMIFGDIDLAAHREWIEPHCEACGLHAVFPLWHQSRQSVAQEVIRRGIRARLVAVDLDYLTSDFCGASYDEELLARLPADICPCGENGEFHTAVTYAPGMKVPVTLDAVGVTVTASAPPLQPTRIARLQILYS